MGTEPIGLADLARDRLGALAGILPIIRDRKTGSLLGTNRRIIGLDSDTLILARMRGDEPIPEACYEPDGLKPLLALRKLRRPKVVPLESISEVWVGRPTLLEGKRRFRVRSSGGTTRFDLPDFESPNLIRVLQALLGDRVVLGTTTGFHLGIAPLVIQVICLALAILLIANEGRPALPAVALLGVFFACVLVVQILDNVPRWSWTWSWSWMWTPWGGGKAGVPPIRAPRLGLVLRLAGALGLVAVFLASADESLYLLGLAVLYLGYLLSARDARLAMADDPRPPILYLRSFQREGQSNLNPASWLATVAGLRNHPSIDALPRPLPQLYNLHPMRLLRIALGRVADRAEEQLGLYFRHRGPFVAIGEPGERLAEPGAARMYVSHETWQQTALDLIGRSQLIVLEPASTEGIWWEVHRVMTGADLSKVLMCMVHFQGRQDDYENFRLRFEETLPLRLPRSVGNLDVPTFLVFDRGGTAHLAELSYVSPLLWPLVNRAVDLDHTLGFFLNQSESGTITAPKPPRRHRGQWFVAPAFYALLAIFVGTAANLARAPFAPSAEVGDPGEWVTAGLEGEPFATMVSLPFPIAPSWTMQPPTPDSDFVYTHGDRARLEIKQEPGSRELLEAPSTAHELADRYVESLGARSSDAERGFTSYEGFLGKFTFEFPIEIRAGETTLIHRVRYVSSPDATYRIVAIFPKDDNQASDAVEVAFRSFVPPE